MCGYQKNWQIEAGISPKTSVMVYNESQRNVTIAKEAFKVEWITKEWQLEKDTKVNSEFLLIKSSGIILDFLPAFYLIIWPITHQTNSLKICIINGTMTYKQDNFCFHESIFHRQIKLISYRIEFWHLRRKPTLLFSKWPFFSKFFGNSMSHIIR